MDRTYESPVIVVDSGEFRALTFFVFSMCIQVANAVYCFIIS